MAKLRKTVIAAGAACIAIAAGATIYATANKPVNVTLDANGGTFSDGSSVSAVQVRKGFNAGTGVNDPLMDHYAFIGWYEDSAASVPDDGDYSDGEVLYAGWMPETYTVSFFANSEDAQPYHTEAVSYGSEVELPEDPTEDGSDFTGWYTDTGLTNPYDVYTPVESDLALYAGFEAQQTMWNLTDLPSFTFVSQVKPSLVWMGCESAALLMALKTTDHAQDITYANFLSQLPMTDTDNPYLGFCGDLYSDTWMRDAVMPNIVAEWGAQYGNTRDLTKQGLDPVIEAIKNGHPVIVWTSVHMQPSETVWDDTQTGVTDDATDPLTGEVLNYHGSTGSHWEYKTHNHVMTLLGYNSETNEFLLGDPAEWLGETYWVTYDTFMASWNCYQGAVEVW